MILTVFKNAMFDKRIFIEKFPIHVITLSQCILFSDSLNIPEFWWVQLLEYTIFLTIMFIFQNFLVNDSSPQFKNINMD